jgi:hypothetical protein
VFEVSRKTFLELCDRSQAALSPSAWVNFNELAQQSIWTRSVGRRIGQSENVPALDDGKTLNLAKFRILKLLRQQVQVVLPPRLLVGERLARIFNGSGGFLREIEIGLAHGILTAETFNRR